MTVRNVGIVTMYNENAGVNTLDWTLLVLSRTVNLNGTGQGGFYLLCPSFASSEVQP